MFEWVTSTEAWIALGTLTALEIVLGIDNIIFISILVGRLPEANRNMARTTGLGLAMVMRLLLLLCISWVIGLVEPWFSILGQEISGRDFILIGGGLFLLAKSTHEIHHSLEGPEEHTTAGAAMGVGAVLVQIALLDLVFSLDSVITAVGLADDIAIMMIAVIISVGIMLFAAKAIGEFVDAHPTIKILALSFLILVGVTLMAEGFEVHVPKGYVYFAMAFSVSVELLNMKMRKRRTDKVTLHKRLQTEESAGS